MDSKSLCKGKRVAKPNKCTKVRGCKVVKTAKRNYCRKAHNKTVKKSPVKKTRRKRLPEFARLKGYYRKAYRELKKLGNL